jgi:hypothetical protein
MEIKSDTVEPTGYYKTALGHGFSMVPRHDKKTPMRWPMLHPDTGKVVSVPRDHAIRTEKAKTANTPWWEPIQVQRDYAELLQRPEWGWDWFGHLTFRDPKHPEAADKIFNKWVHQINRKVFGMRYWNRKDKDGVLWARGVEMQKRDVIHYHFLMSRVPGNIKRLVMMDAWDSMAGFARIHPFEAAKGGETYVVKYAAKGGEIDFGGPLSLIHNRLPTL